MSIKLDIVNGAYSKLRINGLTINPTPELLTLGLEVLEDMMTLFSVRAIDLGYNFEDVPDINSQTGVSHDHNLMLKSNLAVKLAPDFGKEVPVLLQSMADTTLSAAVGASALAALSEVPYPSRMPLGSGNTLRNNQQHKFYANYRPSPVNSKIIKISVGDINDYRESFHAYLSGELITSAVITVSDGLSLISQNNDDEVVFYRVQAEPTADGTNTVKIIMTSDSGRIETRVIEFETSGQI